MEGNAIHRSASITTRGVTWAATGLRSSQGAVDNCCGATYSCIDGQGLAGAILRAGTTLHARIAVDNPGLSVIENEDSVRAHFRAGATSGTFLDIQRQGYNIWKIPQFLQLIS